ncbi:DUF2993 domain-containing protein [Microcoleus sp. FACHB-SPT15]|uniref:LmeA family phospholipid-binding protein n=1 Tax=Microcoleus sp. FACHB-SPT15 TaxID=2692830 RepID=UPI001783BA0A|nr:DUF2993 domain-containing protein [Microcoleus sp. FACHB-SPT15]MBD1809264.1 DUF2993 domain-containing protein [Microcoleus sp. FACHB-SPT15]
MQEQNAGMGEQALNKAAELAVSSKLNSAETIDIKINSEVLQLIQGELNSLTLQGEGLVTPQDLRIGELDLKIGKIAVNLLSAALGKIELTEPTNASVRLVFTTADVNLALNSEYVRNQVRKIEIPTKNQAMMIDLQHAECKLPGNNKFVMKAEFLVHLADKVQSAALEVVLRIAEGGQYIAFEQGYYFEGKDLPLELTAALLMMISKLVNLRDFQYEDIALHLKQVDVEIDKITLWLNALISQIPS